ncbi:uncharacterized protein BP5553_04111 [Venustampulla echinocandica]|uniref:Uncharacterized protein n=1 Tax=Venustampulla echinocandica TaxID=2656787 RepID=A0A370TW67_9HELO|nr:uncharacterized protein BP5553_04111 [Venustampulla echinocandica]RDL39771.1 hypothetical protein BP5553_04111 [Venustampulla echinocandica]
MARNRKEKDVKLKLKQPDRSGPDPSQETLLDMAQKRGLLDIPQGNVKGGSGAGEANEEPLIGRLGESMLWSTSLTMVHFTLDVMVAHQYAVEISCHSPALLYVPSSSNAFNAPPQPTSSNTALGTPNFLLHKQRSCWDLSDSHHKCV